MIDFAGRLAPILAVSLSLALSSDRVDAAPNKTRRRAVVFELGTSNGGTTAAPVSLPAPKPLTPGERTKVLSDLGVDGSPGSEYARVSPGHAADGDRMKLWIHKPELVQANETSGAAIFENSRRGKDDSGYVTVWIRPDQPHARYLIECGVYSEAKKWPLKISNVGASSQVHEMSQYNSYVAWLFHASADTSSYELFRLEAQRHWRMWSCTATRIP